MTWRDKRGKFRSAKPCTCGSSDVTFEHSGYEGDVASTWVVCLGCRLTAASVRGHDEIGALENWNLTVQK